MTEALAWLLAVIFQLLAIGVMIKFGIASYEYVIIQGVSFLWGVVGAMAPDKINIKKGEEQ